ncbi:MAG: transglutaminase family protein, partial [Candidatus Zixiibacteriota bacterium]
WLLMCILLLPGCYLLKSPPTLEWTNSPTELEVSIVMDNPDDSNLVRLRTEYDLLSVVAGAEDDYEVLQRIVAWTHNQWQHSGSNTPSRSDPLTILKEAASGQRFRCVEYAIVTAACARALGMPSRVLALKIRDVETAKSNAGHVVAEVWLDQFDKWVFADAQFDVIPALDGIPLNAVEFQQALERGTPGLTLRTSSSGVYTSMKCWHYKKWVSQYLYYFDFAVDQRFFVPRSERRQGKIMLVPKGAREPKVFQMKYPIENCTYISNPQAFYPTMSAE